MEGGFVVVVVNLFQRKVGKRWISVSRRQNLEDFFEKISYAQRISARDRNFVDYATADIETARSIAFFNVLIEKGLMDANDPNVDLLMAILREDSKAILGASPNTDIFTKLGFRYPKSERVIDLGGTKTPTEPDV